MPSKTPRQASTMRAASHDPEFARKKQIPQAVARHYVEADRRKAAAKRRSR